MPIFISYSQKDKGFANTLAANLVKAKHHVWVDRWELGLGDSLTSKIEAALKASSAILVILSKNSVNSNWCRRELTAGLVRELEENKTVVMPCVIDDCEIPLFLRDKLYADFRTNPDQAFALVDRSLAKISNALQGRVENPEFHTDWAIDWKGTDEGAFEFRWTFIDHGQNLPYVVLSECSVKCNDKAREAYLKALKDDEQLNFIRDVLTLIVADLDKKPLTVIITDVFEKFVAWSVRRPEGEEFLILITYRRLGTDTGMDTVVHLDGSLRRALQQMNEVNYAPEAEGGGSASDKEPGQHLPRVTPHRHDCL